MASSEPPLPRFRGDERRGMLKPAAGPEDLESDEDGLLFLKPLSVLLRCSPVLEFSKEALDEPVLVRECWLFAFLVISLSLARAWVSYGNLPSWFVLAGRIVLLNEVAAGPGLEKLKSILGSTPPEVEMNELGLEF